MGVSKNNGTPKSSILIGFSIIFTIHFGGPPLFFGNIHVKENGPGRAVALASSESSASGSPGPNIDKLSHQLSRVQDDGLD